MSSAGTKIDLGNGLLVDLDELELGLDRCDFEESLYKFLRAGWSAIDPAPWRDGWAIEAVAEHLQAVVDGDIKRLLINIPPRMAKSSLVSVALPAWTWAQPLKRRGPTSGPQVQFMHSSYAEKLSLRDSVKCRRLIQSPWYQRLWGDRFRLSSDQNVKSRFSNDKGGERLITSIGGATTGEGMMIGVVDDANAAGEAFSEATIQTTNDWWDQVMRTRLNDAQKGAFIGVQQRLAEDDWTGHVLSKDRGDWTHLMLPMEFEPERSFHTVLGFNEDGPITWQDPRTEPGELLWEERFPREEVESLKRDLGPYGFAGQMQQRPEPAGGGVIKREWWQLWEGDAFPAMDFIIASLDPAYTIKQENDPSALTVWGVFSGRTVTAGYALGLADGRAKYNDRSLMEEAPRVMLMHAWRERLELHELVTKLATTCRRFKVDRLLIEAKASGLSVAQELQRLYNNEDWAVQLINPGAQDKLARLYSVQHLFSESMIYAPDRSWADMVITEVAQFPKGKLDDLTDTTSQGLRHLRDLGLLTRGQELVEEIEREKEYRGRPPAPLYPG